MDPSYGKIEFSRAEVISDENGDYKFDFIEFKSHECSPEELGLAGESEQHKFWPINKKLENFLSLE